MTHLPCWIYWQDILNIANTWCEHRSPKNSNRKCKQSKSVFASRVKRFFHECKSNGEIQWITLSSSPNVSLALGFSTGSGRLVVRRPGISLRELSAWFCLSEVSFQNCFNFISAVISLVNIVGHLQASITIVVTYKHCCCCMCLLDSSIYKTFQGIAGQGKWPFLLCIRSLKLHSFLC